MARRDAALNCMPTPTDSEAAVADGEAAAAAADPGGLGEAVPARPAALLLLLAGCSALTRCTGKLVWATRDMKGTSLAAMIS
jgi:hypothetical protein